MDRRVPLGAMPILFSCRGLMPFRCQGCLAFLAASASAVENGSLKAGGWPCVSAWGSSALGSFSGWSAGLVQVMENPWNDVTRWRASIPVYGQGSTVRQLFPDQMQRFRINLRIGLSEWEHDFRLQVHTWKMSCLSQPCPHLYLDPPAPFSGGLLALVC